MPTLRELIESAQADLDHYKHPDTGEVETRIDEILKAGKLGGIAHDRLESLYFDRGVLHIRTSYSVRSCAQRAHFEIPESIIDAPDPVAAMKVWAREQRVAKAQRELKEAEHLVEYRKKQLAEVKAETPDA